jgi:hypothetical protein
MNASDVDDVGECIDNRRFVLADHGADERR